MFLVSMVTSNPTMPITKSVYEKSHFTSPVLLRVQQCCRQDKYSGNVNDFQSNY